MRGYAAVNMSEKEERHVYFIEERHYNVTFTVYLYTIVPGIICAVL